MKDELDIFFETSRDLMCIANQDGYFVRTNPSFRRLLGYTEEDLTKDPFLTFVHDDDHKATLREMEHLSRGTPTINFSNRYRKRDGGYVWLEWSATPHGDLIYAIARDVTDHKLLLGELNDEKERFADLSERYEFATASAGIGVWQWNIKDDILEWNDQMYKLYCLKKDDFRGVYDAWYSRLHESDTERIGKEIQDALSGKQKYDTSFRINRDDGSVHYIRAYGNVIRNRDGEALHMTGVNWDITKEKDLDLARSNFISFASHQLRTPLTGIRWVAKQIANENLSDQGRHFVEDIEESASRLSKLVDVMLSLSRLEGGHLSVKPEVFDLILFLDEFLDDNDIMIMQKQQTLKKDPYPRQLDVRSDRYILQNVLQSLLSNAVEYTKAGGTITVGVYEEEKTVCVSISDSGIGIPKEDYTNIFDQFSRGSNADSMKTNGTGLGLYIAKESIELMGGSIEFDSKIDAGTTFTIRFPKWLNEIS